MSTFSCVLSIALEESVGGCLTRLALKKVLVLGHFLAFLSRDGVNVKKYSRERSYLAAGMAQKLQAYIT